MNGRRMGRNLMVLGSYLLIVALVGAFLHFYTRFSSDCIRLTPVFEDARGWEIYTLDEGKRQDLTPRQFAEHRGTPVYLSRVMSKDFEEAGITVLELDGSQYWQFSVFLDGAPFYMADTSIADNRMGHLVFNEAHEELSNVGEYRRCSLPPNYSGKTLTLAAFGAEERVEDALLPEIRLSSEAVIAQMIAADAVGLGIPAAAYTLAALLLLSLFFYSAVQENRDWSFLLLTGAALTQVLYYLSGFAFYFHTRHPLNVSIIRFLPVLCVCTLLLFLLFHLKRWRKFCAPFVLGSVLLAMISPLVDTLFRTSAFFYIRFDGAIYIGMLALLIFAILEIRDEKQGHSFFLLGLGVIAMGTVMLFFNAARRDTFNIHSADTLFAADFNQSLFLNQWGTLLFVLCVGISIQLFIRKLMEQRQLVHVELEKSTIDMQLSVQRRYYEKRLGKEEEVRRLRHDMQGHLNTIATLIKDEKVQEASSYLSKLTALSKNKQVETGCENPYISAVISIFAERFQENDIAFHHSVKVGKIAIPEPELCLILSNALQNSLEAAQKLTKERQVKLQIGINQEQLLVRVNNSFKGTVKIESGLPVTTKSEQGHGYGMTSIRLTAEQLGGRFFYSAEDGQFVLEIAIPIKRNNATPSLKGEYCDAF